MRYHQGFLLLQEMMDSAILRLQYWTNNPQDAESVPRAKRQATATGVSDAERDMLLNLPVYTKQQPYPCYEKDELVSIRVLWGENRRDINENEKLHGARDLFDLFRLHVYLE